MQPINIRRRIFEEIVRYNASWNCVPTQRDIRLLFGGLTEDTDLHLEQLEREGLLRLNRDEVGSIEILPTEWAVPPIEIQASIRPNSSEAHISTMHGSIKLNLQGIGIEVGAEMYGFQVIDNDMVDAGIICGDVAILTNQPGSDIHAVEIDGRLALRRLINPCGIPHYLAENPVRPEMRLAFELPAYGMLWGVIRAGIAQRPRRKIGYSEESERVSTASQAALEYGIVWPQNDPDPHDPSHPLWVPGSAVGARRGICVKSRKSKKATYSSKGKKKRCIELPKPPPITGLNDDLDKGYSVRTRAPLGSVPPVDTKTRICQDAAHGSTATD